MATTLAKKHLSIPRVRATLLLALGVGLTLFTGVTLALIANLSERFGPEVRADLEWRAVRGAQELARASDVGLAVADADVVVAGFGAYATSSDVAAIVAVDADGALVARHGEIADPGALFAGEPGRITRTPAYLASWAPAEIEGVTVGKVAIAVATRRLHDAEAQLTQVKRIVVGAGALGLVLGVLAIVLLTRTIARRDRKLTHYANNLEQMVVLRTAELDERNGEMRLVLDTVAQGFVMIDTDGAMASERSAIVDTWFGAPAPGATIMTWLEAHAPEFAAWFDLALSTLRDGFIPVELCMAQMPKRFAVNGRAFAVSYRTILEGGDLARILVVLDDVTAQVVRERSEREQREMLGMFQRIASDRAGVDELLVSVADLLGALAGTADLVVQRRVLHTLKGNCALHGLELFSELCHTIETELADSLQPLSAIQRGVLVDGWAKVASWIGRLRGATRDDIVEVEKAELAIVIERAEQGVSGHEIAAALSLWTLEPVARRFDRLAQHARGLAHRLGKGEVEIVLADGGVRLDGAHWSAFWAAAVHALRNAIDHGLEPADERALRGKPAAGRLTLTATQTATALTIAIGDDGRGLAWEAIRERARAAGLPHATEQDLVAALFTDGVTTRDAVSDTSGRGVGMAALQQAVTELGGTIGLATSPGVGTTVQCRFPIGEGTGFQVRPRIRTGARSAQLPVFLAPAAPVA